MNVTSLRIYSTIDPRHASSILDDYPTFSQQYTVTFSGLTPGIPYTYDISVVDQNDTTVAVTVTGTFTIEAQGKDFFLEHLCNSIDFSFFSHHSM